MSLAHAAITCQSTTFRSPTPLWAFHILAAHGWPQITWEASPAIPAGNAWSAVEVVPSKTFLKTLVRQALFWVSYCDPFAGIAVFYIISLHTAALGWKFGFWVHQPPVPVWETSEHWSFYPSVCTEGDLPWRKSSVTLLTNPYNLPHDKIIAEELGVHKAFPVGLNSGKFFAVARPNRHFTTERFKTKPVVERGKENSSCKH